MLSAVPSLLQVLGLFAVNALLSVILGFVVGLIVGVPMVLYVTPNPVVESPCSPSCLQGVFAQL